MNCPVQNICGGCPLRHLEKSEYQQQKRDFFARIVHQLAQIPMHISEPVFIDDGNRRRIELTFAFKKAQLLLGFNSEQSHNICNITECPAATAKINAVLPALREFLMQFCRISTTQKHKNKIQTSSITQGEVWLAEAANGIDILLEIKEQISLEHRLLICDFCQNNPLVVRFSTRQGTHIPETILQKSYPYIDIGNCHVYIPAGTFLQASSAAEKALTAKVLQYLGTTQGNIADLFCGVGTFSYPLAAEIKNKITAVDSAPELLASFRQTVNALTIPNIKIVQRNLFKYPLDAVELKDFSAIVFDPPRAGAAAQIKQISQLSFADKPQKIIAVSCNPHTFINDANNLLHSNYILKDICMVDQFVYAKHLEIVALFEKGDTDEFK